MSAAKLEGEPVSEIFRGIPDSLDPAFYANRVHFLVFHSLLLG